LRHRFWGEKRNIRTFFQFLRTKKKKKKTASKPATAQSRGHPVVPPGEKGKKRKPESTSNRNRRKGKKKGKKKQEGTGSRAPRISASRHYSPFCWGGGWFFFFFFGRGDPDEKRHIGAKTSTKLASARTESSTEKGEKTRKRN